MIVGITGVAGSRKTTEAFKRASQICEEEKIRGIVLTNEMKFALSERYPQMKITTIHAYANRLWNSTMEKTEVVSEEEKVLFYSERGIKYEPELVCEEVVLLPTGNKIDYLKRYILNTFFRFISDIDRNKVLNVIDEIKPKINIKISSEIIYNILIDYEKWLESSFGVDFDYMLLRVITHKIKPENDNFRVLVWDEANDSMPLVVQLIKQVKDSYDFLIFDGDPAQTIYDELFFSKPKYFTEMFEKADEKVVLDKTYRVPSKIVEFIQKFYRQIPKEERIIDEIKSVKEGGKVETILIHNLSKALINDIAVENPALDYQKMPTIVTASNFQIMRIGRILNFYGIPYIVRSGMNHFQWNEELLAFRNLIWKTQKKQFDSDWLYYLEKAKNLIPEAYSEIYPKLENIKYWFENQKIDLSPNFFINKANIKPHVKNLIIRSVRNLNFEINNFVRITTIHSSKGMEFENVYVFIPKTKHFILNSHLSSVLNYYRRVVYTSLTRASQHLSVIEPFIF